MDLASENDAERDVIRERLHEIQEKVRTDTVRARRAFILAEEDAGVGLKADQVLKVIKQLMPDGMYAYVAYFHMHNFHMHNLNSITIDLHKLDRLPAHAMTRLLCV
jgi:hypothetical protein